MTRVAVVGTTGWGTTLAVLLARYGAEVTLLARTSDEAQAIDNARENKRHRPGLTLPDDLSVNIDSEALATAEVIVLAVPSASLYDNLRRLAPAFAADATLLSAVKGLDDGAQRMSEVIRAFGIEEARVLALSGPNFASEIAAGLPAATVVAGDATRTAAVQSLLNSATFRVYTSNDVCGVELGGALKNVVAIACGISDGLGYGENAKAALITRALAEITRLGAAAGAQTMTFLGLAGMGDLVLSCSSDLSRNRRLGLVLAQGISLDEAEASIDGVVEGAVTARAVPVLASRFGVELPICQALHDVLYGGKAPDDSVRELMARPPTKEQRN